MSGDERGGSAASWSGERRQVAVIVGPTGVGKTAVGMLVASALGGEIVSADSRQVYRWMDIGTAKPGASEQATVRHHLIDVVEPSETYDAARFASEAETTISSLTASGIEPLVVGGTGFYIESLFEGLFEGPGRDDDVRAELYAGLQERGAAALHGELAEVDPETASRLHPNDAARVLRALEVYVTTGTPLSVWHDRPRRTPACRARYFGLTMPRADIYARIDRRVDAMIDRGLLDEIRGLVDSGRLRANMPGASAVGYRELLPVATGETAGLDAAVETVKTNTRRYAKRQLTWFTSVHGVEWLDLSAMSHENAAERIVSSLQVA